MPDGTQRQFEVREAVREQVPLFIGLVGPSSSGKTFTALRLATGMQRVCEGPIVFIDTENRRALHYADNFKFQHIDFGAPFGSLDYLAALQSVAKLKPACIIVDSMSHEHEGPGGMIAYHEAEVDRMSGGDRSKAERVQMLAWQKPKAARRALLQGITRLNTNVICCFRAGEKTKPVKNEKGRMEPVEQGFTAIAGDEFVYEMTLCALFRAGARGVPTWTSDLPGERKAVKLPGQFDELFAEGGQMTEDHGEVLAKWAIGGADPSERPESFDAEALAVVGDQTAKLGTNALRVWWETLSPLAQDELRPLLNRAGGWKTIAARADKEDEADK